MMLRAVPTSARLSQCLPLRRSTPHRFKSTSAKRADNLRFSPLIAVGGLTGVLAIVGWAWTRNDDTSRPLSYAYFVPLTIKAIKRVTSDSSVISFELPKSLLPEVSAYPEPPHTPLQAVYVRQPELQIQRAYTPLSLECFAQDNKDRQSIDLLVKKYKDGEVSSYLHRQAVGDQVWIAGGTGLTPLIQLLSQREALPKTIKVVYATSSPSHSLLPLLPKTDTVQISTITGRLQLAQLNTLVGKPKAGLKTQIIVCGPEEFITNIAGKRSLNAQQDEVGGILGRLGWQQHQVKKL